MLYGSPTCWLPRWPCQRRRATILSLLILSMRVCLTLDMIRVKPYSRRVGCCEAVDAGPGRRGSLNLPKPAHSSAFCGTYLQQVICQFVTKKGYRHDDSP
jgi:hypothetical protein